MAGNILKIAVVVFPLLLVSGYSRAVDMPELIEDEWLELKSPHFHILTDADEEMAKKLALDLERFRFFISVILRKNLLEGVPPLNILAISDSSTFHDTGIPRYLAGRFHQTGDGSFAIANIEHYDTDSDDSSWGKTVLMHEYVHYAMGHMLEREFYPPWYNEGIAEYLSTFRYDDRKISLGNLDVLSRRFSYLRRAGRFRRIDIEDLFKAETIDADTEKRSGRGEFGRFYARSLAAVHYMHSSDDNKAGMARYLDLVSSGQEVDAAFRQAFGKTFEEVDEEIRNYLNSGRLMGIAYNAGEGGLVFPEVGVEVKEITGHRLYYQMMNMLIRLNLVSGGEREKLIKAGIENDPDNLQLKVLMADHYLGTDVNVCEKLVNEILEQNPAHATARAIKGDLLLDRAQLHRMAGLEGWNELLDKARRQYRLAVQADRLYLRPYQGVGRVYTLKTDNELLEEGVASLDSARLFAWQGQLPALYYQEALLRIRMRDYGNAVRTLGTFLNLSNSEFAEEYGRFVYEAMEYRRLSSPAREPGKNRYTYEDGSVYTGGWKEGKPEGKGKLVRPNGALFKGIWSDGLLAGEGEFVSSNGYRYRGEFHQGEITGTGKLTYPIDSKIRYSQGEFFNGLEHGEQEFIYRSAERAVGQYWMGQANGRERYIKPGGGVVFRQRVFGAHKIDVDDHKTYTGSVDEEGRPHGKGACYDKKAGNLSWCEYDHGAEAGKAGEAS